MKQAKTAITLALILLFTAVSGSVLAAGHGGGGGHGGSGHGGSFGHGGFHGGHFGGPRVGFGFYFGAPFYPYYGSPYYYPPYAYAPYPAYSYAPAAAPAYVEQGAGQAAAPAQAQGNWWYYCADSQSYYPYVRECPAGWARVAPQPPSG